MASKPLVTGIKDIDRRLRRLEPKVGRKVLRQAMRAALKPMVVTAKANAPRDSGELARSIKIRAPKKRKVGVIRLVVRAVPAKEKGLLVQHPKSGKWAMPNKAGFYGGFPEFGTKKQVGQHFMYHTFTSDALSVKDNCITLIRAGLDREIWKH